MMRWVIKLSPLSNVSADQVIAIQVFGKDIQNANGLAARFEYDANQVTYDSFDAAMYCPCSKPFQNKVRIQLMSKSHCVFRWSSTANSGLIGTVRFRTTAAFSGTEIRLGACRTQSKWTL